MTFIADAGTPIIWASGLHLLFGNLIIGGCEAAILVRWFRAVKPRAFTLMIIANYLSMIAGMVALSWSETLLKNSISIVNIRSALVGLGCGSYLLSVVLELPFVAFAITREHRTVARSLAGSFLANAASYAVLVILYWQISGTSLVTSAHIESPARFCTSPDAEVYYIGDTDGALYRVKASGENPERLLELGVTERMARLFAKQGDEQGTLDLWIVGLPQRGSTALVQRSFARLGDIATNGSDVVREEEPDTWFDFRSARTFDPTSPWHVSTAFWALGGLEAKNRDAAREFHIALETPLLSWYARSATLLPNAQVIYQLQEQIVLLDLPTKRMGLITMGHGPLVVRRQAPGR